MMADLKFMTYHVTYLPSENKALTYLHKAIKKVIWVWLYIYNVGVASLAHAVNLGHWP